MSLKKNSLICFAILLSFAGLSQNVVISGKADGYKGNEISLYYYNDYLTFHEVKLASTLIDSEGSFKIKTTIPSTIKAFLKIENIGTQFYIEPNRNYNLSISTYDSATARHEGSTYWVPFEFTNQDSTDLNIIISEFNSSYDKFLNNYYPLLITKKANTQISAFKKSIYSKYEKVNNRFFKDFMEFSFAILDQISYSNKYKLFSKYLDNKSILYQNPEYMAFFREFFDSHILLFSQSSNGSKIVEIVNKGDYPLAFLTLKKDSLLANDALRELVLIKGLYENYYSTLFDQKGIDLIMKKINTKSPFPEHRKIAENILLKTSKLAPGQKAPDFTLLDSRGKETTLEDFKGKYVYLNFWATWCIPCLQEMKVMEKLNQKYGDKIIFVSISIDKNQNTMNEFIKKHNFNWIFLHYGYSKKVKNDYDITHIPAYFLISPDGEFIQSPAESPINYIEMTFSKLFQTTEKRIKVGDK